MGNIAVTLFDQTGWGKPAGRYQHPGTILVSGQEDPRTDLRGHTSHLNLKASVRFPERYLLYHEVFEQVAQQGGISGYAHTIGPGGGVIEGLAMDVPIGLVSFVEVLHEYYNTDIWFDFLNLGFQLAPAAGTDYPYSLFHPGDVRNYVHVDGEFSVDAWYEALAAGRTYVTNGPLLEFQLNDKGMGEVVKISFGGKINIDVSASINPDIDSLAGIELIEQGEAVADVVATGFDSDGHSLSLRYTSKAKQGTWFVVKAYGESHRLGKPLVATSAPIYVSVDGDKFWHRGRVEEIVHRLRTRLLALRDKNELQIESDSFLTQKTWRQQWPEQKRLLNQRIDWAIGFLDQLVLTAANR